MEIKHQIWLEKDGLVIFGKGLDELLRAIDECQSLNAATKKLNISYRHAWRRLRASEERLNMKLVEVTTKGRGGMYLTAEGQTLLAECDRLEKNVVAILKRAHRRFDSLTEHPSNCNDAH